MTPWESGGGFSRENVQEHSRVPVSREVYRRLPEKTKKRRRVSLYRHRGFDDTSTRYRRTNVIMVESGTYGGTLTTIEESTSTVPPLGTEVEKTLGIC